MVEEQAKYQGLIFQLKKNHETQEESRINQNSYIQCATDRYEKYVATMDSLAMRIKLMANQTLQQIIEAMTPLQSLALHNQGQRRNLLDGLIRLREEAGLSQADIGQIVGVSQATIAQLESSNGNPTLKRLISHALLVGAKITIMVEKAGPPMSLAANNVSVRSSKPGQGPGPKPKAPSQST